MATSEKKKREISEQAVALAEQLGRILGTIEGTAEKWLNRGSLTQQLTQVRDGAAELLDSLADGAAKGKEAAQKESGPASRARAPKGRGDLAHAPGKKHRKAPPSVHGAKHSDERIPKARGAAAARQRLKAFR